MNKHNLIAELESLKAEWGKSFTAEGIQMALDIVKKYLESEDAIKMSLDNVLMLIGNFERIIIIEGKLAFVDKHIYNGLNSDFFTFCTENDLHSLRQRSVRSIECGVNIIYIFIEKETNQ